MRVKDGKWLGGYRRKLDDGRVVFVIEKMVKGVRVHLSTGCVSERNALKEFEKWEADPFGYRPREDVAGVVHMDDALVLEYRRHQLAEGLTREWVDEVGRCLAGWTDAFTGRDLRAIKYGDLRAALAKWPTRHAGRMKAIKGFFRWLRQERGLITRGQDATLDLRVPQARPEKWERRKVVPPERVRAVLMALERPTRDILHLLTATAWHLSEVKRLVEVGELVEPGDGGPVLAVLIVRQKSGGMTKTGLLYPEHVEAAKRLRALKKFPKRMTLSRHMHAACEKAGLKKEEWFGFGQMRHSVLTWGVQRGATLEQAADFADHRSKATTSRFYIDLDVPKASIPILRLVQPG